MPSFFAPRSLRVPSLITPLLATAVLLTLACSGGPGGGPGGPGGPGGGEEEERPVDPRTLIEVSPVATGSVLRTLVSTGSVESVSQANLMPEATGTVVSIKAEEGDRVRKGQVLAVIDNASLDAALERSRAELARAEADLNQIQGLRSQGAVSQRDLQDAERAVQAARTALSEASSTQGHTRLVSPINGTVAVRDLRYGEVAGGQRAFQVVDLDNLRVVIQLPERDLGSLKTGQTAALVPVYDEELEVPATVERISPTVDPMTGTVRVTVALVPGEARLRPGQFVSVRIEVERHDDVPVVPRVSVVYQEGEPGVYRVAIEEEPEEETPEGEGDEGSEDEGPGFLAKLFGGDEEQEVEEEPVQVPGPYRIARRVPVELDFIDEDNAEIVGGLELGDEVVVVGQSNLRDGGRVRYPDDKRLEDAIEEHEAAKKAKEGEAEEPVEEGEAKAPADEETEAAPEQAEG